MNEFIRKETGLILVAQKTWISVYCNYCLGVLKSHNGLIPYEYSYDTLCMYRVRIRCSYYHKNYNGK
uniref:Uncharacterized protein n=1 Tax=Lepeophtheirus salmonis TaxID=72036 RepID=A0A0K2U6F9_LEPSM